MNRIRMRARAASGDKRAERAMRLSERFDNSITTLLVGNNLVNIAIGSIATLLAIKIAVAETVMTVIVTVTVILLGEVIPKTLAKRYADKFIITVTPLFNMISVILKPITVIFGAISNAVARMFEGKKAPEVSEDDIYDMIETMDDSGNADSGECRLLYSAFEFSDITVGDIYTDKSELVWVDKSQTEEEILHTINSNKYSRLLVCDGGLNNIIGVLRVRPYLESVLDGEHPKIMSLISKPIFVTPEHTASRMLEEMQHRKIHLAVVRTSDGRTLGIVSIEDLIEELVGEIWDESDNVNEQFKKLSENSFEVSARLSVPAAFELMEYEDFERDECGHLTLAKWIQQLADGAALKKGSIINYRRLGIEVLSMKYGKIARLRFVVLPEESEAEQE